MHVSFLEKLEEKTVKTLLWMLRMEGNRKIYCRIHLQEKRGVPIIISNVFFYGIRDQENEKLIEDFSNISGRYFWH